ncbi:MAG: hypothetical protein KKG78_06045 [Alphaproteobacteria bacterium]|nr:hypothetical protein [Alphaproteobacteria bacterium]
MTDNVTPFPGAVPVDMPDRMASNKAAERAEIEDFWYNMPSSVAAREQEEREAMERVEATRREVLASLAAPRFIPPVRYAEPFAMTLATHPDNLPRIGQKNHVHVPNHKETSR